MRRPVCYDVTRLLTRILNATPNGIDRIDHALAGHFLAGDPETTFGATATGLGARLMSGRAAGEAVDGIAAHWGEAQARETRGGKAQPDLGDDPVLRRVVAWLRHDTRPPLEATRRRRRGGVHPGRIVAWTRRHGLPVTRTPRAHLPIGSTYVNVSQFPLWVAGSFEWLEMRPDIAAAFFIHDLLPLSMPEYFPKAELERHRARMRNFARFAAAAIVTTPTVADDLRAHMDGLGRSRVPVFVSPTPTAPVFATPRVADPTLAGQPYFVLCSTLEPRKNHLMILAVWRALVARRGEAAPKLLLVGTRGWHYAAILDLVERCPALRTHVLEVAGLSTPSLKHLIDNALGLLMPSFGEGYGLPVHEALTAGAPVVASDIPVFRSLGAANLTLLSPLDGEAWIETIDTMSRATRPAEGPRRTPETWATYFTALDGFLEGL